MDAVMDMEPAICAATKAESIENTDVITMRNINKSYRMGTQSLHVLKDVSLTVKQGEYLAILGPSGSGKSTLMNIIGCMDVMDSGNYLLDGVAIEQAKEKELVKIRNQKIGFIFQKYHLIPTYNVLQNIVMPLLMRGMGLAEAQETSMDTIDMLGLSQRIGHKPNELSGGQQQRVAIARAMVKKPDILLCDELTGALDTKSSRDVLQRVQNMNDTYQTTVVIITHNLKIAEMADRIIRIIDGKVVSDEKNADKKRVEEMEL